MEAAIQTSLMLRTAFKLALRQTDGLMTSVLTLMGLTLSAPNHTTRRKPHVWTQTASTKTALCEAIRHVQVILK